VASFRDPESGLAIDNCPHVILGCCTEAIGFLRRIGSAGQVRFYDRLNLIDGENRLTIEASGLPAPLHLLGSVARNAYLSGREKAGLCRVLAGMLVSTPEKAEAAGDYLRSLGCSDGLMERLIGPVIVSALNETPDEASAKYARMVLYQSLVGNRRGYRVGVAMVPQSELIGDAALRWLAGKGCEVRLLSRVRSVHQDDGLARAIELASGERLSFDAYVLAVPPDALARMGLGAGGGEHLAWRPIVCAHLFFDGRTPPFEPACVVGEPFGWVFSRRPDVGHVEVVASAADRLANLGNDDLLALARRSAAAVEPACGEMPVRRGIVYRTKRATFATLCCDAHRPAAVTPIANLFVAGDWTDTGWPATIESAVRSGRAAAKALLEA